MKSIILPAFSASSLIGEKSGCAFTGNDDTANLIVFGKLGRFFEITPVDWLGLKTDFR